MTAQDDNLLTRSQLAAFQTVLHQGAEHASGVLDRWVQKPTRISFDSVEQLPLQEATSLLGVNDEPICFCAAEVHGRLTGQLILAFDDASGLQLADIVLNQSIIITVSFNNLLLFISNFRILSLVDSSSNGRYKKPFKR